MCQDAFSIRIWNTVNFEIEIWRLHLRSKGENILNIILNWYTFISVEPPIKAVLRNKVLGVVCNLHSERICFHSEQLLIQDSLW